MVRPAPMQDVELVELDDDPTKPPAAGPTAAQRWRLARRWAPYVLVLVLVAAGAQAVDVARDRAALAELREVPGVVRPVDQDVRVLWTPDEGLASMLRWDLRAGGALIGLERPRDGSQALVAVDELSGERLWSTPLAPAHPVAAPEEGGSPLGGCVKVPDVSRRVACLVSDGLHTYTGADAVAVPGELSTVVVLDTSDGSVVAEHTAPGAVAFTVLPNTSVVAVQGSDNEVTLVATDLLDGGLRWRTTLPAPAEQPQDAVILDDFVSLFGTSDGLGAVVSPGRMMLLSRDGEVLRTDIDASAGWLVDPVTRAAAATSIAPDGSVQTTLVDREGADITLPGRRVMLSAHDGSVPGLVLMSDSTLHAYDGGSGVTRWSLEDTRADSALLLRGRVYVATGDALVALDADTGEELWRTPAVEGRRLTSVVTDGLHLLSAEERPDLEPGMPQDASPGTAELVAYRLDDGREDWRADLPDGVMGVWSTGSTLVGWGVQGPSVLG